MGGRILTGEVNCSDIKVTTGLEVEGRTNHATVTEGTKDLDITINRKEYNIVGDDVYIPKLYDDAPQWLKDLVDVVVEVGVEANNADLLGQVQDLINQLANATVPLNTFTQSIIALNLEDARINTVVETLNSNFSDATSNINAQIIDVRNTFVSKSEAASTIATVLAAEISNGQLKNMATVGHVATALATETAARAADYNVLEASLMDEINNVEIASASAIQSLNTSVSNINGTLTSQAGQITTLTTAAAAVDGKIATASSNTINTVNTTISNGDAVVTSKWAYGSILNIGGVNYTSGFGLSNSSGTGVGSEFWIDASKLKFTNSAKTGKVAPFTIDASGTTPQVKFNGVVEFSNTTGGQDAINASLLSANTYSDSITAKGTNLIYADWATGSDATSGYNINGTTAENYRVYGDNHLGNRVVLWECRPDGVSDGDGGWDTNSFTVDKTKSYRFSVFVKTSANTGTTYFGCGGYTVVNLNTSTLNANPYFWSGDLPTQNEWYLIVGYVHPTGSTGITTKGGIYNCTTGAKVANISSDFAWSSTTTTSYHRCYHYYDTTTTTRQWMWNPRVEQITGNEPSILDLIGNFTKVEDISWQSEVQAAINNNATTIDGGKIVTNTALVNNLNALGGIVADSVKSYSLTSTNATIQNGLITNAKIADAAITTAKIVDGNITNAKIGYASVDTLKIQGEAIVVPRFAEAIGSNRATIYYTPTVTHTVLLICNVQWSTGEQYYVIGVNGAVHKSGRMGSYGSSTFTKAFSISTLVTLSAGVAYSLTFQLSGNGAYSNTAVSEWTQITMMGAKR